jgi:STE24 endopeptidase
MNLYAAVILAALLVDFVLKLIANVLNLKALRAELPAEFEDVYPAESYAKAQQYTRIATQFGFLTSVFDLLVLLVFWLFGGFNLLDVWLRGLGFGSIVTGLLFIGILLLGRTLLNLPFQIFSTFVLEQHFGFNRMTARTFVLDLIKSLALSVILGGPLAAAVLWLFEYAGDAAWLYCWGVSTVFLLVLLLVFPRWIMPLFNRFEPLGEGELRDALSTYADDTGFALADVFVIDGSRRSSRSNAFFTGFGRTKRIGLYDTLIEKHTVKELVAILAHEVGHYAKGHITKGLVLSILHNGLVFFLLSVVLDHRGLFDAFKMQHMSIYAGLVFFALLYSPVELMLSLFLNVMSRKHELEADRFAAETTGTPAALISALKKLSADNLSNLTPHPFYVFLNQSHPPLCQRVAALRRLESAA